MKKEERIYLTLDEKMDELVERIYQCLIDDFDMRHSEEEIEEMEDNDTYFDTVRAEKLEIEGYEETTFNEMCEMPYEDIVKVHNIFYGSSITVNELNEMKVFYNGCFNAVTETTDENGNSKVVKLWRVL